MWHDSVIMLVSDHGGGGEDPNKHGSDKEIDMTIFFGAKGNGIRRNHDIGEFHIMDVAPMVALSLGLRAPHTWKGHAPSGMFIR